MTKTFKTLLEEYADNHNIELECDMKKCGNLEMACRHALECLQKGELLTGSITISK